VCCAATTSTPTASSPRAICSASPSTTSASTPSNFGCGSSREHAPQALARWGFDAFVGGSFAEIFFGNCTALGLPCVTLAPGDLAELMDAVDLVPEQTLEVDLEAREVRHRGKVFAAKIPDGSLEQLLEGTWNATAVLLDAGDAIEATAARLPYTSGFRT